MEEDSKQQQELSNENVAIEMASKHGSATDVRQRRGSSMASGDQEVITVQRAVSSSSSYFITLPRKATETHTFIGLPEHEEPEAEEEKFSPSSGLTSEEAEKLLSEFGRNELEEKIIPKWYIFCSQLWQPMPIMIWLAVAIEAAIEDWVDMAILLAILFGNASLSYYEITKAGNAVAALKASLRPEAVVKRDGTWQTLDAAVIVPGDLVSLKAGAAVPADVKVNQGQIDVDQAALTGESLPITKHAGDVCHMGSTVVRGETEATVEFTGSNTFFGKTAALLGDEGENSNLQKVLITIVVVLVALSLALCIIVFVYLLESGQDVHDALAFTIVLLVASIPIAIEIVCTTTLALGSNQLATHGAIVTRLAAIEDMAGMSILCSDKTGTLTLNKLVIQDETPTYIEGENQYSLLRYAAMAANWKEPPRDALDTLVLNAVDLDSLKDVNQTDYLPFDPTLKRTEGTIKRDDGTSFKVTKGAPKVIWLLCEDEETVARVQQDVRDFGEHGIRALALARTELKPDGEIEGWKMLGLLTFLDPPRLDTKETIDRAHSFGVDVKMITGDHRLIAKETARVLGMGTEIHDSSGLPLLAEDGKKPENLSRDYGDFVLSANGFAEVFPEHKYLIVECLREMGFKVGMTGDGVNDAPALKRADVGVAVEGATDAARAAADIVLTQPGLGAIVEAIIVARTIFRRMKNFIMYRIAATLQVLIFFFIAVLAFPPPHYEPAEKDRTKALREEGDWPDFFNIPVLMLILITVLNDGTMIAIGYDHVRPSHLPDSWKLPALFAISSVLAAVALGSSILLLWCGLDSWSDTSVFHAFGLPGLTYGQIVTMIYLQVAVADFLTLFSARTFDKFFWDPEARPAPVLLCAAGVSLAVSTIIAATWPKSSSNGVPVLGLAYRQPQLLILWVWIYCLVWWVIQDVAKVVFIRAMYKYNWFGVKDVRKTKLHLEADAAVAHAAAPEEAKFADKV